jgi:hypothetical protein
MKDYYRIRTKNLKELARKFGSIPMQFIKGLNYPFMIRKVLFNAGNDMRNYVIKEMRNTKRAPYSYIVTKQGGRHFPSVPWKFPAVQTGQAISAIAFETRMSSKKICLEFGALKKRAPYLKHLELGTKDMQPRPWLKPTIKKFGQDIFKNIKSSSTENIVNFMKQGFMS